MFLHLNRNNIPLHLNKGLSCTCPYLSPPVLRTSSSFESPSCLLRFSCSLSSESSSAGSVVCSRKVQARFQSYSCRSLWIWSPISWKLFFAGIQRQRNNKKILLIFWFCAAQTADSGSGYIKVQYDITRHRRLWQQFYQETMSKIFEHYTFLKKYGQTKT